MGSGKGVHLHLAPDHWEIKVHTLRLGGRSLEIRGMGVGQMMGWLLGAPQELLPSRQVSEQIGRQ